LPEFLHEARKGLISACIVTRNASASLKTYLESLRSSVGSRAQVETLVVDNDSSDDTEQMLKRDFPAAQYIFCQPGVGFSKGINKALAASRGEFVLIATPSTEIIGDAVPILLSHLEKFEDVGVVGPKVLYPAGNTQFSSKKMPTPYVAMLHSLYLFGILRSSRILDEYFLLNYTSDRPLQVESLTMSLLLARRQVFETCGFLDEQLFAWASDVDWCHRVEASRWKQFFVPQAKVIHRRNSVSKKQPYANLLHYHRDLNVFYQKHYASHNGPLANFLWGCLLQVRFLTQVVKYLLNGNDGYSFY